MAQKSMTEGEKGTKIFVAGLSIFAVAMFFYLVNKSSEDSLLAKPTKIA